MKDVLPSLLSWYTLISNPSQLHHTRNSNMLSLSMTTLLLTPGPCLFKAAAITAAKDFLKMVCIQHNVHIVGWMSNAGREYKYDLFD